MSFQWKLCSKACFWSIHYMHGQGFGQSVCLFYILTFYIFPYHFNSSLEHTALQPFWRWALLVWPSMSYQIIRTCIHLHLSEVKPMRAKCIAQGHNIETMMSQHWDISLQILHQAGIGLSRLYPLYHCATSLLALEWVFFSFHHRRVVAVWFYSTSQ